MAYTPRQIDLDLFVNSASKGYNDGAKVPGPFAAFVDSFAKGMDASQDYQTQALEDEKRQIQIEQAPYQTEILKAQAEEAKAKAQVIAENPEAYKDTIIKDWEAKKAADQNAIQQQKMNQQKTKLLDIMTKGDGKLQGDAYVSGEFNDYFNAYPEAKKRFVDETYKNWEDNAASYYDNEVKQKSAADANRLQTEIAAKEDPKNRAEFMSNTDINTIKSKMTADFPNVSYDDILREGQMVPVLGPKPVVQKDKDGKIALDEFKNPIYGPPKDKDTASYNNPQERMVFRFRGKQYEGTNGIAGESVNVFGKAQGSFRVMNGMDVGQGQIGDLKNSAAEAKEQRAAKEAEAREAYEATAAQNTTNQQKFNSGATVAPSTVTDLYRRTPEASRTPEATNSAAPVLPQGRETLATPTATPTKAIESGTPQTSVVVPTPQATLTPTAQATTQNVNTPKPQWQQAEDVKKQMSDSKSKSIISRYNPSVNNISYQSRVSPQLQAKEATRSSNVPTDMIVNSSFNPNQEGINTVNSLPEAEGLPAITKAVMVQESSGKRNAISKTNVKGLMQVTRPAALDVIPSGDFDLNDPLQNTMIGSEYLKLLISTPRFESNPMLGLTAYNTGSAVVSEAIKRAGTTDWNEVKKHIGPAVKAPKFADYWRKMKVDPDDKATEASEYAEKVIVNFPAFATSKSDMNTAAQLRKQGVIKFNDTNYENLRPA